MEEVNHDRIQVASPFFNSLLVPVQLAVTGLMERAAGPPRQAA